MSLDSVTGATAAAIAERKKGRTPEAHELLLGPRGFTIVTHRRHLGLQMAFKVYDAQPPTKEGRTGDLIAWGATFLCEECGPICPFCGREGELAVLFVGAGWVHKREDA